MTPLSTLTITTPGLQCDARWDGQELHLRLAGSADLCAKEPLSVELGRVHDEAVRLGATAVVVDVRDLDFMGSRCFVQLVRWIERVQELDKQYEIRFLSNPSLEWQRRSLYALECFSEVLRPW